MKRRKLFLAATTVVGLVALTGCNIAARVVVQPDGSGTYSVILTAPKGLGNASNALYQGMAKAAARSSVPLRVTKVSMRGESGAETTFAFQSLADLKAESDALASTSGGLGIDVTRTGTGWHFSAIPAAKIPATTSQNSQGTNGGTSTTSTTSGVAISGSPFEGLARLSVVLTLPGRPGLSNATTVTHGADTTTFSWVSMVETSTAGLNANTVFVGGQASVHLASGLTVLRRPGSRSASGSGAEIALAVVAVIILAGLGLLVRGRRQAARPAVVADRGEGDEDETG